MKNILFVCTGNTCRSPMAEALLNYYGKDTHQAKSAGVFAMSGEPASKHAITAINNKGIQMNHSSKQITEDLLNWSSHVLTMTANHKQFLVSKFPKYEEKIFTLYEYANGNHREISDPYGGPLTKYENTLTELEGLVKKIVIKSEED